MIPVDLSTNCEGWIYDPNGSGIQILGIRSRDPFSGSTHMSGLLTSESPPPPRRPPRQYLLSEREQVMCVSPFFSPLFPQCFPARRNDSVSPMLPSASPLLPSVSPLSPSVFPLSPSVSPQSCPGCSPGQHLLSTRYIDRGPSVGRYTAGPGRRRQRCSVGAPDSTGVAVWTWNRRREGGGTFVGKSRYLSPGIYSRATT